MNKHDMETPSFRCPTCGAEQAPSSQCRRCKCELGLVVHLRQQADSVHQSYLRHLRSGNYLQALDCAFWRLQLMPDETARRLLAVAYLRLGKYQAALEVSGEL